MRVHLHLGLNGLQIKQNLRHGHFLRLTSTLQTTAPSSPTAYSLGGGRFHLPVCKKNAIRESQNVRERVVWGNAALYVILVLHPHTLTQTITPISSIKEIDAAHSVRSVTDRDWMNGNISKPAGWFVPVHPLIRNCILYLPCCCHLFIITMPNHTKTRYLDMLMRWCMFAFQMSGVIR